LLDEGKHASHPIDLDYGQGTTQTWGGEALDDEGLSTGWETNKDTAPTATATVTAIHPNAHIKAKLPAHTEVIQGTFRKAEDMGWVKDTHHPNMVIPANISPTAGPSTDNRYSLLSDDHA
jgi:hypothetical protein